MVGVPRDKHQVTTPYRLDLFANAKFHITIDDNENLVVVHLRMEGIAAVSEDRNIRRQMLTIYAECSLDWVVLRRWIDLERLCDLVQVLKVGHNSAPSHVTKQLMGAIVGPKYRSVYKSRRECQVNQSCH
jgi:hypothetical protein